MTPGADAESFHYRIGARDFHVRSPRVGHNEGEAALRARPRGVPVDHQVEWARAWGSLGKIVEVWSGRPEQCICSLVVDTGSSRLLPGYELWHVDRLVELEDVDASDAVLAGLVDLAAASGRVLSVSVGIAVLDDARRGEVGERASRRGYRRRPASRGYERTLKIDLTADLDEIFAGLHSSCRRGVRAVSKNPIEVHLVRDATRGEELQRLHVETMGRTGGARQSVEWDRVIQFAARRPEAARLVGMRSLDGPDAGQLLSFALGLRQDDHVEYRFAASTRAGVQAPLGYALAWDLIRWAHETGATWFDFGGLPSGPVPDNIAGIVRFKRSFGGEPVDFREEWVLEARPTLETLRKGLAGAARTILGATGRKG